MEQKEQHVTEIENLKAILGDDYWALMDKGDDEKGFTVVDYIEGDDRRWSATDTIVVLGPSGQHYAWYFERGLTEMQPSEREDDTVNLVYPHTTTVTITRWKDKPSD